jgi:hypothetical protein
LKIENHLLLFFKYVLAFKIISKDHNFLINTGHERDACSRDEQKKKHIKLKKKKTKKSNREKKPIKSIRILKKPTGSVRFGFSFTNLKPKNPNPNQKKSKKKSSQTGFNL